MDDLIRHYRSADAGAQTSPPHQQAIVRRFAERARSGRPVERVLDLGSGRGANLDTLSDVGAVVVAADVSEEALLDARARRPDGMTSVSPVVLPGEVLPFADGSFELAVCTEVLEHVPDLRGMAAELERVTQSGGHLIVSTPNYWNVMGLVKRWRDWRSGREDWDPWHAHAGGLERHMTARRLRRAFPGCDVVESTGADYASALGIAWAPVRRRVNRWLLLRPARVRALRSFGMQYYLLLRKR